ncbi:hypothetical protein [Conexibacter sp. CPCC 206217]|uniref:hypothetical protein n=1 Tax=Conexibacter sp. CPCC 206217 TaxID=3064574 RepID=UPI002716F757|nr:hypothetical protein [Conexibacter sp. CPCC 206217]MDO8213009.1 hypothetical protein [Conexibacter sp. CPCC 206217]
MRHLLARAALLLGVGVAMMAAGTAAAVADGPQHLDPEQFAIESFTTASSDMSAGGHPDVSTVIRLKSDVVGPEALPYGRARRIEVDLPAGLVGNPTGFPACTLRDFNAFFATDGCRPETQVGIATVTAVGLGLTPNTPIFNLEHGPDEPVLLGMKVDPTLYAFIRVQVRPDGGLTAVVDEIPVGHPIVETDLTLWGVPADHNGSGAQRVPFMTGPTECDTIPTTNVRAYSYEGKTSTAVDALDTPPERCGAVPFKPTMTAEPTSRAAAGPTGLDVRIDVPQNQLPDGRAAAHVKQVQISLPEGMKVSPSSANGLGACAPGEFGYQTNSEITCPDSSKIGSVSIKTPLLTDSLHGSVYLAKQNDNPFNSLLAMYIVAEGSGVTIKLAGRVDPDPVSGRLTATFDNNPQLPFETLDLQLKSGPRAPLTNPQICGTYQSLTTITSWARQTVTGSTPMTIDQDCQPVGFSPAFNAGTVNPVGGGSSTFSLTFARGDHDQELRDITVDMPTGLTGKIASADLCPDAIATAGDCGEGSKIGTVTTAAGPGSNPFYLPGRAYITGPYKGAPFGLSFVVPAVAGPFDLGTVVVRAAIFVDQRDASLRVVSDPLPRILQGIPLQIRSVNVAVDKPGFMINPTSCAVKDVLGRITSQLGAGADVKSRFQVGDCGRLPVRPKMLLEVGARGKTARQTRTPFTATLTQTPGQSGLRSVEVTLPKTLNSRLDVVNRRRACSIDQFNADRCPMVVGRGTAVTPLLRDPLAGPAYFVYNPARRLPDLVVRLRGQVAIDLVGKVTITRDLRLQTTFDTVPDVPVTKFRLALESGPTNGPIGVVRDLCRSEGRNGRASLAFIGHNGRRLDVTQKLRIKGCGPARRAASRRSQQKKRQKKQQEERQRQALTDGRSC